MNPYERNSKPSTGTLTANKTNIKTATASCVRNASDYLCEISIPWSEKRAIIRQATGWVSTSASMTIWMKTVAGNIMCPGPALPISGTGKRPICPIGRRRTPHQAHDQAGVQINARKAPDTPAKTTAASQAEASSEPAGRFL